MSVCRLVEWLVVRSVGLSEGMSVNLNSHAPTGTNVLLDKWQVFALGTQPSTPLKLDKIILISKLFT